MPCEEPEEMNPMLSIQSAASPIPSLKINEGGLPEFDEPIPSTPTEGTSINNLRPTQIYTKREATRGVLALVFILGFFIILILGGLLVAINNSELSDKVKNLQDVFLTISGVLSGPLGFVVGYYFRRQETTE